MRGADAAAFLFDCLRRRWCRRTWRRCWSAARSGRRRCPGAGSSWAWPRRGCRGWRLVRAWRRPSARRTPPFAPEADPRADAADRPGHRHRAVPGLYRGNGRRGARRGRPWRRCNSTSAAAILRTTGLCGDEIAAWAGQGVAEVLCRLFGGAEAPRYVQDLLWQRQPPSGRRSKPAHGLRLRLRPTERRRCANADRLIGTQVGGMDAAEASDWFAGLVAQGGTGRTCSTDGAY